MICAEGHDLVGREFAQLLVRKFADLRGGQCRHVFCLKYGQLIGGQRIQGARCQGFGLRSGQGHHRICRQAHDLLSAQSGDICGFQCRHLQRIEAVELVGRQHPDLQCGQGLETASGQARKLFGVQAHQLACGQSLNLLRAQAGDHIGFETVEL